MPSTPSSGGSESSLLCASVHARLVQQVTTSTASVGLKYSKQLTAADSCCQCEHQAKRNTSSHSHRCEGRSRPRQPDHLGQSLPLHPPAESAACVSFGLDSRGEYPRKVGSYHPLYLRPRRALRRPSDPDGRHETNQTQHPHPTHRATTLAYESVTM